MHMLICVHILRLHEFSLKFLFFLSLSLLFFFFSFYLSISLAVEILTLFVSESGSTAGELKALLLLLRKPWQDLRFEGKACVEEREQTTRIKDLEKKKNKIK